MDQPAQPEIQDESIDPQQLVDILAALKLLYKKGYIKGYEGKVGMELKIPYEQLRTIGDNVKDDSMIKRSRAEITGLLGKYRDTVGKERQMRLVVTGASRCGKSSLILALGDNELEEEMLRQIREDRDSVNYPDRHDMPRHLKAKWFVTQSTYNVSNEEKILISDTRGFREAKGRGISDDEIAKINFAEIVQQGFPDCFLHVINPVIYDEFFDKAIEEWRNIVDPRELDALGLLQAKLKKEYGFYVPVLVVITHCDQIYDPNIHLHENDDELTKDEMEARDLKIAKIDLVRKRVRMEVQEWAEAYGTQVLGVTGVCIQKDWNDAVVPDSRKYWNVDSVWKSLFEGMHDQTPAIIQARNAQSLQIVEKLARDYIDKAVARTELTDDDQVEIIRIIAHLGQKKLSPQGPHDFIKCIGLNSGREFALKGERERKEIIRALGEAAIDRFIRRRSDEEAQQRFFRGCSATLICQEL